jgi:hypothetical protein
MYIVKQSGSLSSSIGIDPKNYEKMKKVHKKCSKKYMLPCYRKPRAVSK